jgi:1-phosphatidylinositol-3-phosphate 5-kinase
LPVQEQAQLRKAVDRIASFEPDILLVEKSAARFTQDALLEKRIALVLNVKGSLLDRLARCTGAQASSKHSMSYSGSKPTSHAEFKYP